MKLVNVDQYSIVSCKAKSDDFVDGVNFMLEKLEMANEDFNPEQFKQHILEVAEKQGLTMPTKDGSFGRFIDVNDVFKILKENLSIEF